MISEETLERVRDSADIVQIISDWVKLKRAGNSYRGPCPFHNGKGPNFSVIPDKGIYHCFKCGESGDVFKFVQKKLGIDFTASVKLVGEKSGIEVIDRPSRPQPVDPNAKHWEVLASSSQWFREQLKDPSVGREALQYLSGRGIDAAAIERFELGYSPRDEQALRKHLHSLGFNDDRQIDAGILRPAADGRDARIGFRDRVMFPIVDDRGNHVGFGGRAMGDATPKYLNSAASDVYRKGETLYGMHAAKHSMRRERQAIVVEGYMDAIRVALAGFENVVAPLGTALTEQQAALIVRHAQEIFLLYDSDKAGQTATFKSGLELLRHSASVRVVSLPNGEDPDTFTRTHGRAGLEAQLEQAIDLFDRQVQLVERKGMFGDISKQRVAIDLLLPTIRAAKDPLTREMYLTRLSEKTHLDKVVLQKEADAPENVSRRGSRTSSSGTELTIVQKDAAPNPDEWTGEPMPAPQRQTSKWIPRKGGAWKGRGGRPLDPEWRSSFLLPIGSRAHPAEHELVRVMVADRLLVNRIGARRQPERFKDSHYQAIFGALLMLGLDAEWDEIAEVLEIQDRQILAHFLDQSHPGVAESIDVDLLLNKLEADDITDEIDELLEQLPLVSPPESDEIQRRVLELTKERNKKSPVRSPRGKPKY